MNSPIAKTSFAHLRDNGTWTDCVTASPKECSRYELHMPKTAAELNSLPVRMLLPLLEAFDPPSEVLPGDLKMWINEDGKVHRLGDLPAVVYDDGSMFWYQWGKKSRAYGRPAVIMANGRTEWWTDGNPIRSEVS